MWIWILLGYLFMVGVSTVGFTDELKVWDILVAFLAAIFWPFVIGGLIIKIIRKHA